MNAQNNGKARLGLGLAALGRPGYINLGHAQDMLGDHSVAAMHRRCHEVLDFAWDAGVRYFDVAASYGKSEVFLADWLLKRSYKPVVGSKWGYYYTANWQIEAEHHEIKEHTLTRLERQWQNSQQLLGDHLDLYQIHSATFESGVLDNLLVLERLAEIKQSDMLIGLTLSGPNQADVLRKAMSVSIDGTPLFDAVQATWNVLEPSVGDALAEAHANGMEVIVKEGLANGRLTQRNAASEIEPLNQKARSLGVTPDAVALAAVLAQPWASIVLSGAATKKQLASNVAATKLNISSSEFAHLAESPVEYWATRSALNWN